MGKEGFVWWYGVVEDRFDPLMLGRCKVRALGWHTDDKTLMPTSKLPWAFPLMPLTSGSQTGVGHSPTGPVEGTWIMGYFRDGESGQEPVMMGTLPGIPENVATRNKGFNDPRDDEEKLDVRELDLTTGDSTGKPDLKLSPKVPIKPRMVSVTSGGEAQPHDLGSPYTTDPPQPWAFIYPQQLYLNEPTTSRYARGMGDSSTGIQPNKKVEDEIVRGFGILQIKEDIRKNFVDVDIANPAASAAEKITSPSSSYAAVYPYNHVHESESGHLIEIDDTPEAERLHWYHRSGTFTEFHPRGTRVDNTTGHAYVTTMGSSYEVVKGKKTLNINRDLQVLTKQGYRFRTESGDIKFDSDGGNFEVGVTGDIKLTSANVTITASDTLVMTGNTFIKEFVNEGDVGSVVKGSAKSTVVGASTQQAASQSITSSTGDTNISAAGNIAQAASAMNMTAANPLVMLNPVAIRQKALAGLVNIESFDGAVTGGVELNVGPLGKVAHIKLNPAAASNPGGIDMKSIGMIKIESKALAEIKAVAVATVTAKMVELKADVLAEIKGKYVLVGGKDDFAMLASKWAKLFSKHYHDTANGPSGPPDTSSINSVKDVVSKKVALGK